MANKSIKLEQLATSRSGDKGNHANIGVVARNKANFEYLQHHLMADLVADYFQALGLTHVERFELPKIWALNFVLYNALAGGASRSLRMDSQGKLLGTAMLQLELPAPEKVTEILSDQSE